MAVTWRLLRQDGGYIAMNWGEFGVRCSVLLFKYTLVCSFRFSGLRVVRSGVVSIVVFVDRVARVAEVKKKQRNDQWRLIQAIDPCIVCIFIASSVKGAVETWLGPPSRIANRCLVCALQSILAFLIGCACNFSLQWSRFWRTLCCKRWRTMSLTSPRHSDIKS